MANILVKGKYLLNPAQPGEKTAVLPDAAVAVTGSSIAAVGGYAALKKQYPDYREVGSNDHLILPGLIDVHHHGWGLSAVQQGALDDTLEPWILRSGDAQIADQRLSGYALREYEIA